MDLANFINPKTYQEEINIAVVRSKAIKKKKCLLTGVLFAYQHFLETISLFIYLVSSLCLIMFFFLSYSWHVFFNRGAEWYLKKRGSRKILAGSRNLGSVFDKSRSLVFAWFVFTFFESRKFLPKSLELGFLTRISASRRVSDFTFRQPLQCLFTFALFSASF